MKTKRFWKKAIIVFAAIIVIIAAVIGEANFIYIYHLETDDDTLLESYETKQEKCELIKSIPNDFIEEGKGINLQEIPDNIRYEIKNKSDRNIQFYYYIETESSSDSNPYKAWITLSKDYKVIEEKYGDIELDDFETYKNTQRKFDMFFAVWLAMAAILLLILGVYVILGIVWLILHIWIKISDKKKSRS